MIVKIDFLVDLGWLGVKVTKNTGVQIFTPPTPVLGAVKPATPTFPIKIKTFAKYLLIITI